MSQDNLRNLLSNENLNEATEKSPCCIPCQCLWGVIITIWGAGLYFFSPDANESVKLAGIILFVIGLCLLAYALSGFLQACCPDKQNQSGSIEMKDETKEEVEDETIIKSSL